MPDPEGMDAARPAQPAEPTEPHRTWQRSLAFHLITAIVCAAATFAAAVGSVIVGFGTSVCNDPDTSDELLSLRLGLFVIGSLLTAFPVGAAVIGAKLRMAWQPWAAIAMAPAALTLYALAEAQVGTWCF
jgi:hypothetical protein